MIQDLVADKDYVVVVRHVKETDEWSLIIDNQVHGTIIPQI